MVIVAEIRKQIEKDIIFYMLNKFKINIIQQNYFYQELIYIIYIYYYPYKNN